MQIQIGTGEKIFTVKILGKKFLIDKIHEEIRKNKKKKPEEIIFTILQL